MTATDPFQPVRIYRPHLVDLGGDQQLNGDAKLYAVKRIGRGLFAMLGVFLVLEFIPYPFTVSISSKGFSSFDPLLGAWSALQAALAATVGAYVARIPFAAVAASFTVVIGLATVRIVQYIAEPVEKIVFLEVLARNSLGIAVAVLGAVVGAEIGLWLTHRSVKAGQELI